MSASSTILFFLFHKIVRSQFATSVLLSPPPDLPIWGFPENYPLSFRTECAFILDTDCSPDLIFHTLNSLFLNTSPTKFNTVQVSFLFIKEMQSQILIFTWKIFLKWTKANNGASGFRLDGCEFKKKHWSVCGRLCACLRMNSKLIVTVQFEFWDTMVFIHDFLVIMVIPSSKKSRCFHFTSTHKEKETGLESMGGHEDAISLVTTAIIKPF